MRTTLIVVHSVAGLVAIGTGYSLLDQSRAPARRSAAHVIALVVLVACLVAAIGADWASLDTAAQVGFPALGGLGLVMILRAERARRTANRAPANRASFISDIGFTLVGLIDGFVVILALGIGAPPVVLVTLGVAIAVTGHLLVDRAANNERENSSPPTPGPANASANTRPAGSGR